MATTSFYMFLPGKHEKKIILIEDKAGSFKCSSNIVVLICSLNTLNTMLHVDFFSEHFQDLCWVVNTTQVECINLLNKNWQESNIIQPGWHKRSLISKSKWDFKLYPYYLNNYPNLRKVEISLFKKNSFKPNIFKHMSALLKLP